MTTQAAVLIAEYATNSGERIIELTLNSPTSLNALSAGMIDILMTNLPVWDKDDQVVAIIIRGAGERAFCAGGDIRDLYHAMVANDTHLGQQFFNFEYSLDLLLHNLHTPLLVWGNGYVMGGGMGIYQAADIRIVTPSSRLAMPEVSIGLYPDVGATLFLQQVPDQLGLFMGLTAAMVNGTDACHLKLADYLLAETDYRQLIAALQDWDGSQDDNCLAYMQQLVAGLRAANTDIPASDLAALWSDLSAAMQAPDLSSVVANIAAMAGRSAWLDKAIKTMQKASPTSLHLTYRQQQQTLSQWYEAFIQEYYIAVNATRYGEFQEGIRALLIDKDASPDWRYKTLAEVPAKWLDSFYQQQGIDAPDYA
ncbi:MAG: enoyl-CoA hydratase/isomerase family protein [Gammaproteobacteria bacterium]|jgi:enoyl-CoA hydratase/carnithine racemase|nr:enoyl-CoA hydratase/isomerase family protein [Gammaproteobacteria bacterium]